jgi:hypothetical protein
MDNILKYEWPFDTRLVIIHRPIIWNIMKQCNGYVDDPKFRTITEVDQEFITFMAKDDIIAVPVDGIYSIQTKKTRGYWVLSFKSAKQATLFKIKYGQCL